MAGNSSTAVATRQDTQVMGVAESPDYMENLMNGDLSKLTPDQRLAYYLDRCNRIGLDPMSQPFLFMKTRARDGEESKTILYATRSATDQIGKRDGLSGSIVSKELLGGVAIVVVRITGAGRSIENMGAASYKYENQAGDALKRAITQGYRRGIVQFSGLGMVSEEDIADIQGAQVLGMHDVLLPESEAPKRLTAAPVEPPPNQTGKPLATDPAPQEAWDKIIALGGQLLERAGVATELPDQLTRKEARLLIASLTEQLATAAEQTPEHEPELVGV